MSRELERRLRAAEKLVGKPTTVLTEEAVTVAFAMGEYNPRHVDWAYSMIESVLLLLVMGHACRLRTGAYVNDRVPCFPLNLLANVVSHPAGQPLPPLLSEYLFIITGVDPATREVPRGQEDGASWFYLAYLRAAFAWRLSGGDGGEGLRRRLDSWFMDPAQAVVTMPDDVTYDIGLRLRRALPLEWDLILDTDWRQNRDTGGQGWTIDLSPLIPVEVPRSAVEA